jgi:hypothetical protein
VFESLKLRLRHGCYSYSIGLIRIQMECAAAAL